ncbi:unnamed protein product, partial [Heterotrigona itama]
ALKWNKNYTTYDDKCQEYEKDGFLNGIGCLRG